MTIRSEWGPLSESQAKAKIARLTAENAAKDREIAELRGLVQCTDCSEMLGDADYYGWMAGICPGCQAEQIYGGVETERVAAPPLQERDG